MSEKAASITAPSAAKGPLRGKLLADLLDKVTGTAEVFPGGISVRVWKVYIHVWLVCLIFPVAALVQLQPDAPHLVLAVAGLAGFVGFYTWFMRQHPFAGRAEPGPRSSLTLFAIFLMTILGLLLSLMFGPAFLWLFVGTSMVAGRRLPLSTAHLVATVLPFLSIAMGLALNGSVGAADWLHLLPLALLIRAMGLNMLGLSLQFKVIRDLREAQEELARRAATEERLRLARDLHDLLGHTLSLIALKSELVGRLIEKEPGHAEKENRELELVARQALREVRQAVADFRQPSLYAELEGARQMLAAAGISFTLENTAGPIPPSIESVLAWVVRAGVTNVIRHSRARHCTLQLTHDAHRVCAEINNDGYIEPSSEIPKTGSGLAGLAERVKAHGGTLQAGLISAGDGTHTFRLRVEIPLSNNAE